MGFTWSEDLITIDNEDVNELKTNLDTLYSTIGLNRPGCSGAAWTLLPVSGGNAVTSAQLQQVRDVADYARDNCCSSDNASDYGTAHNPYNSSVDSGDDSSVQTHNTAYNATEDNGHDNDDNGTYYNNQDTGYNSSEYASNDGTDNGSYFSNDNTPEYAFADTGYDNDDHNTYNGTYYPGNVSSENTTVCSTDNGTVNSGYDGEDWAVAYGNYGGCATVYYGN